MYYVTFLEKERLPLYPYQIKREVSSNVMFFFRVVLQIHQQIRDGFGWQHGSSFYSEDGEDEASSVKQSVQDWLELRKEKVVAGNALVYCRREKGGS